MAKKKKRAVKKRRTAAATETEAEEPEEEPVQYEEVETTHPGIPRIMVTWNGTGSGERESKIWYGIEFEAGKPVSVEHSPHWNAMRHDIDADRNSNWSYAHVIEQPPPEEPPPPVEPPPEPAPEEEEGSSRRGRR